MVITLEKWSNKLNHYKSTHIRYAFAYVIITVIVLLFLNIYSSKISQELFYNSKEVSMIEKCHYAASEIASAEVLNNTTVTRAVTAMGDLNVARLIVTDISGQTVYDSNSNENYAKYSILPEIVQALNCQNAFTWEYYDGAMQSKAACPIISGTTVIGSVYIMEYDADQGALIDRLQRNTLTTTAIFVLIVIVFSAFFSSTFSRRIRRIMASMRIIRSGDYSHKVEMGGNDELTILGDEFNDLIDKLRESEQKRHNFVSDASHELKTPLASIKLLTDSILQNEMNTQTILEFVEDIGNEADRLNRLSEKLLILSRIDSQENNECEIVNFGPTIERAVRMLKLNAKAQNITIHTDLQDDCPILILVDDLYQIVFNLIENGIKYNTPNGDLYISVNRTDEYGVLTVTDTGMGIPDDALPHIFERFYRVDKARSRKTGGSGLGLSIVRNIIERNNGEIEVSSQIGTGTTFTVRFPIFDTEEVL